uniref:Protein BPS1, chloroplastic n=1 Tax=Anthurium amnicola TaxID=1678845 RepID=A0A1D1XW98_9ARAE
MSRPHDGHRLFFPFGNPFRMILPRGSSLSPKLKSILNSFEETLADRFKKLKPKDEAEIVSLSWMRYAMESLSETHKDIKILITDLQFPVSYWDGQWMDMYLDNSVKLLDLCISFSSEISRLDQGQLLLQYALHVMSLTSDFPSAEQLKRVHSSLNDWLQQISSSSSKLGNSCFILQELVRSLCFTKVKNSAKGKILMRAMYGVKLHTIFVCSVFSAAFMSSNPRLDLEVSDKVPWAESFTDLQTYVNGEIRSRISSGRPMILRELEAVSYCVENLHALIGGTAQIDVESFQKENGIDHVEDESLQNCNDRKERNRIEELQVWVAKLGDSAEKVANGLDLLSKQVGDFFQIVLSGRDALLSNLRVSDVMEGNDVDKDRL